jgi:UPF0755 protein
MSDKEIRSSRSLSTRSRIASPRNVRANGASGPPPAEGPTVGRRARRVVAALLLITALVSIVAVAAAAVASVLLFRGMDPAGETIVIEIRPGQGLRSVSTHLVREGLARSAVAVELYGRSQGFAGRLQAGRYLVSPAMSPSGILDKIVSGDAVFDELTVTIPEGWSLNDIEDYFERIGLFAKERFQQAAVMQPAYRDFAFLSHLQDDTILDGYLFPDTYRIFSDSTPESIVRRMLANFDQRVTVELRERIESEGRTLHEVLTLASIVQAESAGSAEMPMVAGVFTNRLRIRMPLESDATVNYVLGTNKRQPTFADTRVQDPYNTYQNYGLPPGPIGNPGLAAILATIDPAEHDFLFFLHPLGQPGVFSRTFAEHLRNKAIFLDSN